MIDDAILALSLSRGLAWWPRKSATARLEQGATRNERWSLRYLARYISLIYTIISGAKMDTARIFQSGRSQAVRLPKEFRFAGTEVGVRHFGNGVLLLPADDPWATLEAGLSSFEPGFTIVREQPEAQTRNDIAA
jgi:antitoxin VapB